MKAAMHRRKLRWVGGALVLAAVALALGSTRVGAQRDDARRGTDPLSVDEIRAATEEATPLEAEPRESEALGANGLPQQLVLMVQRHEEDKSEVSGDLRRADVFEYSYADDTLTLTVVDLTDGSVDATTTSQGNQLPLVPLETDRAREVLFADPGFLERLATEYSAATGRTLGDPSRDLDVQPIVFRADAVPTMANGSARECGVARCAQFLIQSTDHVLINLFPLVNLSEGALIATDGTSGG